MKNVERGTIKSLRIVAVESDAAAAESPVSLGGTAEPKRVIGDVPVADDGSVLFEVPMQSPLLFQLLDDKGRTIQSMRKPTALNAETTSCFGCHPDSGCVSPKPLEVGDRKLRKTVPLIDPRFPFRYSEYVQPIWDKHCTSCHNGEIMPDGPETPLLSFLPTPREHRKTKAIFTESYLNLVDRDDVPLVDWIAPTTTPPIRKPYSFGSIQSDLMVHLEPDHYEVELDVLEKKIIACWIDLGIPFGKTSSTKTK